MRLSNNQKTVLKLIGTSLLIGTAMVAPNTAVIYKLFKPKNNQEKRKYNRGIKKLFDDKIIYLSGERIELTKRGKEILRQVQVEDVQITVLGSKDWDGVWHLVGYDIPEDFKNARDCLRRKLVESGFEKIQLSLWVYPYNCKEEIAIISQNLGVAPFVAYLNTDYLPQHSKLIKIFGLTPPSNQYH